MGQHQVKRLPVVDNTGTCIGMLSNRDIRRRVAIPFFDQRKDSSQFASEVKTLLSTHRVSEAMSSPIRTCSATDDVLAVAKLLRVGDVSSLVVLDANDKLIGIVTRSDLLDQLIRVYEPVKQ